MSDAVQMMLDFWIAIIATIPNSPFIYMFALAIVLIILNNLYFWMKGD